MQLRLCTKALCSIELFKQKLNKKHKTYNHTSKVEFKNTSPLKLQIKNFWPE